MAKNNIPPQLVADLSRARILGAASQVKAANYAGGDPVKQKSIITRLIAQTEKIASNRERVRKALVSSILQPAATT